MRRTKLGYQSVLEYSETIYIVDKSKFIAYVKPIDNEGKANEFIEMIKKKNWNATHNVPIYLIGEKMDIQKISDDGEPSGTAALPILNMLKKERITNIVIVITRYFGGVKLGKGGLVRAYTHSAKLGLSSSKIVKYKQMIKYQIEYEYSYHGKIENFIMQEDSIFENSTKFGSSVIKEIMIDVDDEYLINQFVEITGNNIEIKQLSLGYYSVVQGKLIGGSTLENQ